MLRRQNYVIPGYVQPGYIADWAPADGLKHVNHASMSFDLRRMPVYPEFSIEFNQWSRESGGGVVFAGSPYAVRLFHTLSWPSICKADRDNLELFFRTIAKAQANPWTWWNPIHGNSLPVRFADADFPETPQTGYGYYDLSGLRLMVDINFPGGQIPAGSPAYSTALGTVLAIGSAMQQMPPPGSATASKLITRYSGEDTSAGTQAIWQVGQTVRRQWMLSWANLKYIHFIGLVSFFCSFVRGMGSTFTWYESDGTAHIVRLAEPKITITQVGYDRFECDLPLIEDI